MISRSIRFLVVAMPVLVLLGCGENPTFRQARKAELRKDYDSALVYYSKALQEEPENAKYLIHEKVVRTHAADFHMRRGQDLLKQNRQQDAIGEFQKAVRIDPTNQAAAQKLTQLLEEQAAVKKARETAIKKALETQAGTEYPSTVELQPLSQERMKIHISADSRRVYETLAKLGNLNVAFTSDFQPRPVALDLTSVKIEDALRLVGYQTKSFYKPVTPNTILVVPDTPANRRDYQDEVLKTVYLSNPLSPADRTAITTALKQILGLQRIIDNPDSNAIVIRDTPERVAEAEKLIHDLDRGKAEILIEVSVIEADRDRARDLGLTQVPVSPLKDANVAGILFTATTKTTQVISGTPTTVNLPGIPLKGLDKIGTGDFSIVVPGAVANALLTDSHTHILQNPQVRVTDGQTAKVNIGSRVPYATGSFGFAGSGLGTTTSTSGINPGLGLANTQFQYQDVGVNLELTPHLLADGEVNLHAKIDISSVGASVPIGGLSEPSFNQRKIEHDIRLKEGEVNLLGGLIESSVTASRSGLPWLSELPFLGYLFSTVHNERTETEVLVMLTPRVIRLPENPARASQAVKAEGGASGGPEPGQVQQPMVPQRPGEQQPEQPDQPEPQFQGLRQMPPGSPQPGTREPPNEPEP